VLAMKGAGGLSVVVALVEGGCLLVKGHSQRAEVRTVVEQAVRLDQGEAESWELAAEVLEQEASGISQEDRDAAYRTMLRQWKARQARTNALDDYLDTL